MEKQIETIEHEKSKLRQSLSAQPLEDLIHFAFAQHIEDPCQEIHILHCEKQHGLSPMLNMELIQTGTSLSHLKASLDKPNRDSPISHHVCVVPDNRVESVKLDLQFAQEKIAEYKYSVHDQVFVRGVNDTLAQAKWNEDDNRTKRKCFVPDYLKGIRSKGLCKGHGGGKQFQESGCKKSNQGGGYCIVHGGGKRCSIDECKNSAQVLGYCKAHSVDKLSTIQDFLDSFPNGAK